MLCCLQGICQEEVGTFTMGYFPKNPTKKVECTNPDAADFRVFIDVAGGHSTDIVNLILKEKNLFWADIGNSEIENLVTKILDELTPKLNNKILFE